MLLEIGLDIKLGNNNVVLFYNVSKSTVLPSDLCCTHALRCFCTNPWKGWAASHLTAAATIANEVVFGKVFILSLPSILGTMD